MSPEKKPATSKKRPSSDGIADPPATEAPSTASLRQLLDNLGGGVLQVVVAPAGLDTHLGNAVIADPLDTTGLEPASVVLAVGVPPDGSEARELIAAAGSAGAAAVAFKLFGRECQWTAEAEDVGVALLAVSDEIGWSQLNHLLTLTIPSLQQSSSVPGLASVPLGDLFSLANAIAALVGGAITIEDAGARVLSYSTVSGQPIDEAREQSILGRRVPDTPGIRALYKRLSKEDAVIRIDEVKDLKVEIRPRIAAPIRVGRELLGSIWAVEGDSPLGPTSEKALADAARVAALHMIHARSSRDIERQMKGDLLRSLLEGRGNIHTTSTRLGIESNSPMVVLAIEIATEDIVEDNLYRERLVDLVATYSEAFRLRAACVAIGRSVYALLPVKASTRDEDVMRIARDIHDHTQQALNEPLNVAVSSTVADLRKVPDACHEAERVLRVLGQGRPNGRIASIGDVSSQVTLLALQDFAAEHPDFARGPIQEIARHDEEKGTTYLQTLRAYVESFGDLPAAAAALGVHKNTFRYRLRRLIELFDVDVDDPDERLVVELQLNLLERSRLSQN